MDSDTEFDDLPKLSSLSSNLATRKKMKPGAFQTMGLSSSTLKAIKHMGYQTPTPIQRKTIPFLLEGKDVVGMARTGSGKTAAFLIPLVEKLKTHSTIMGARALILAPSRELALQTYQFVKNMTKYSTLRTMVIVGGDSMEHQFNDLFTNPDILIATPGRLLHLVVETKLELTKLEYIVLDEADRLFELGFEVQLHELLHRFPDPQFRQTVLFSATLPKFLIEFAKAGLKPDPYLVRLDTESKLPKDLEMSFFTIKACEKEASLLYLLKYLHSHSFSNFTLDKKLPQIIVFFSTKHHVEYFYHVLTLLSYSVSYIYGSLDQAARQRNHQRFLKSETNILLVTDVAARGIDIPVLDHVINYDFPSQSKVFIHRVGRAARAGRRGWAWSFVTNDEMPYLLDLELFLSRPLFYPSLDAEYQLKPTDYMDQLITGGLPSSFLESEMEWLKTQLTNDITLAALRKTAENGYKHYLKSRPTASSDSHQRYKLLVLSKPFGQTVHPLFQSHLTPLEHQKQTMLLQMTQFRPSETIFEIGHRGNKKAGHELMKLKRLGTLAMVSKQKEKQQISASTFARLNQLHPTMRSSSMALEDTSFSLDSSSLFTTLGSVNNEQEKNGSRFLSSSQLATPSASSSSSSSFLATSSSKSFQDPQFYLNYLPPEYYTEKGYQAKSTTTLTQGVTSKGDVFSLLGDESSSLLNPLQGTSGSKGKMYWDSKKKKFKRATVGADNQKLIKGESGIKLPATYRSDRFQKWQSQTKKKLPRVGAKESSDMGPKSTSSRPFSFRFKNGKRKKGMDVKQKGKGKKNK